MWTRCHSGPGTRSFFSFLFFLRKARQARKVGKQVPCGHRRSCDLLPARPKRFGGRITRGHSRPCGPPKYFPPTRICFSTISSTSPITDQIGANQKGRGEEADRQERKEKEKEKSRRGQTSPPRPEHSFLAIDRFSFPPLTSSVGPWPTVKSIGWEKSFCNSIYVSSVPFFSPLFC